MKNSDSFGSRSPRKTNSSIIDKVRSMSMLIYVETSIPSFYFDTRRDVEIHARRNWTRLWWSLAKPGANLVTGFPVLAD
jgi:hypothetical protein